MNERLKYDYLLDVLNYGLILDNFHSTDNLIKNEYQNLRNHLYNFLNDILILSNVRFDFDCEIFYYDGLIFIFGINSNKIHSIFNLRDSEFKNLYSLLNRQLIKKLSKSDINTKVNLFIKYGINQL